jgi:hypothetical protein
VSAALDTEFDRILDGKDKQDGYAGSVRPIRLENKRDDGSKPMSLEENSDDGSKTMSFEEAVAAGLVPTHIVSKEMDQ